ncbi:MAG TPA: transporter substrate-binding domain-containing protein [Aggregatilineales bacterium]|nr:transporter substrate-binding domain-containing protein [Aggregatilineales bacterium]
MRKALILMLIVLSLVSGALVMAQDNALPDLGGRVITVAVENAYPPFNFIDEVTNQPGGWDYDAVNEICARLNCVPDFIETPWDGMILAVSQGEYDVAGDGITITAERAEIVDFSIGYIATEQVLLVRIDEDRFTSIDELVADEALIIGTQPGTTNYELAAELLPESRIAAYDTFGVAVQALIDGQVDAVFMDSTAGQGYTGLNGDRVKITGEPMTSDQLGFIFPKGSDLTAAFNAALESMIADRTLEVINGIWFPKALPDLGGRTISIAIENAYVPFNSIDPVTNEAVGWDYDAINEICARVNCVPEFIETPFEGTILAVSQGEFDMSPNGFTIAEDRKEVVDFSIGYARTEQVLLTRIDEDRFASFEEFAADENLLIGVQTGTTNYELAVSLLPESRIVAYEQFGVAIQALIDGQVDAVVIDSTAGQGFVGVNADRVKITGRPLLSDQLAFIYPKDSEIRAAFDLALIAMMADGKLDEINAAWFAPAVTE